MRQSLLCTTLALSASLVTTALMGRCEAAKVTIKKVKYYNNHDCVKLSNGTVDVIITTDIGPRIIAYRLTGGENMLREMDPKDSVKTEWGEWHPYGGHRFWHAPEVLPRSYVPDSEPVKVEELSDGVMLTQNVEKPTLLQKHVQVQLSSTSSEVTVTHTLFNRGVWPVEAACWGLTIMHPGGEEIIPNEVYASHDDKLTAARSMVLWNYTDLSDSRFTLGKKFVRVRTDAAKKWPNKLGFQNTLGWTAYAVNGNLFVKRYPYIAGATYPDQGCNFETYTDGEFLECETLAPLITIEPGTSVFHVEKWSLFQGVKLPVTDDALEATLTPLLKQTKGL
jgi:hypothetical protein